MMIQFLWQKVKTVNTPQASLIRDTLEAVEMKDKPQIKGKQDDVDLYEKYATVSEVFDDLVNLKCSDSVNCTVDVNKFEWKPLKGDKVRVRFMGGEDSFKEVDMEVHTLAAVNLKKEFGRVTAIDSTAIVFEGKIVFFSDASKQFSLNDELEYTAIDSTQEIDDLTFDRRIVEILSLVDSERVDISMEDVNYSVVQSRSDVISRTINIVNNSNVKLTVERCSIEPENFFVKLQQTAKQKENTLFDRTGRHHVVLKIFPRALGIHEFTLVVDFITPKSMKVQKKCKISLEVFTRNNVISGPRPSPIIRFTDISIKQYEVPSKLRLIDFIETRSTLEVLREKYSFLNEELSAANYRDKMHLETFIEEISLEVAFKKYSMKKGRFENIEKDGKVEFMRLKVKDVAEKRPSIGIGDKLSASDPFRPSPEQLVFEGFIYKVEDDAVLVKPDNDFPKSHHGKDFRIDFHFSRSSFRNFHHAVDTITSEAGLGFNFLFPEVRKVIALQPKIIAELDDGKLKVFNKNVDWIDNKLNAYQKEAIVNILRGDCRPLPYIIYGPPGTGKTMTVVELIMQLASLDPDAHLIVATPSNSAANIFTEKLASSGRFNEPHDFVRFVSHNQIEKNLVPEELRKYCATISIGAESERHPTEAFYSECGIRKNCTKSNILNYRVCIATLSCFGSFMKLKFPRDHFTHVIIDESGQSIEAESLIPMTLVSKASGQVILAGDPKQLGPVMSTYSQHLKLDSSLLERLLTRNECYSQFYGPNKNEFDNRFVTKLKINYRSLPSILGMYNKLFYGNELEGVIKAQDSSEANLLCALQTVLWKGEKNENCGIYFINVDGKNQKVADSCSWHNEKEASAVKSFLWKLHQLGLSSKDIGVITPYALQVKKLKQMMSNLPDAELKIGTVEEFQGLEREIILISTVRTEKTHFVGDFKYGLGFLHCPKRMNVAISRARSLLVIFGKEDILTSFGGSTWKSLIELTKENGTFFENG